MTLGLTGLRCDMPVGFMAGLGLIRIAPAQARLAWNPTLNTAELHGVEREDLLDHLLHHMRGRHRSAELHLCDDVRGLEGERFREFVESQSDETLQWVRALWREDGDKATPTNLCFTSGRQLMVQMARKLAQSLDPLVSDKAAASLRRKFDEALFGPWRYEDDTPSWGWDPAQFRIGAQTAKAPESTPMEGVAGAYWLAWEALPFLPCIPGRGTVGFVKENRITKWTWASWSEPLPRDSVEAIVRRPWEATALGGKTFEAEVVKSGYYQFFRPGRLRV